MLKFKAAEGRRRTCIYKSKLVFNQEQFLGVKTSLEIPMYVGDQNGFQERKIFCQIEDNR